MGRETKRYQIGAHAYEVQQFDGDRGPKIFLRLGTRLSAMLRGDMTAVSDGDFEFVRNAVIDETKLVLVITDAEGNSSETYPPLKGMWRAHFSGDAQGDLFLLIGHALALNFESFFVGTLRPWLLEKAKSLMSELAFLRESGGSPGDSSPTPTEEST